MRGAKRFKCDTVGDTTYEINKSPIKDGKCFQSEILQEIKVRIVKEGFIEEVRCELSLKHGQWNIPD